MLPMNTEMAISIALGVVSSFFAVRWIYFKILKIAFEKRLVDNPDARKLQKRPIPVVGGLAVFFGVLAGMLIASVSHHLISPVDEHIGMFPVIVAMGIMLYVGSMDDIVGLTPRSRLLIEIVTILCLIYSSGLCIDTFRGMWGVGQFSWWIAVPLTVFAGVGIVNAINMIDGVNGLSSGLCMACCILFGVVFIKAEDIPNAVLAFTMASALLPFYIHNVFGLKSRMFIGDAGTMVMGILMTWFLICMLSSKSQIAYYSDAVGINLIALSLAILSVPVFDTLRVMAVRILHKQSPFKPDKTHLHHIFVNVGFSHFVTAVSEILIGIVISILWGISVICGASLDLQLYIVVIAAVILVWGTYLFLLAHAKRHTEFLHKITHFSIKTHLGRTDWWQTITSWLDAPGDYSSVESQEFLPPMRLSEYVDSIAANSKEENRKMVLDYLKGKAEVYVFDLKANCGADKGQILPILFEEIQEGYVTVIKSDSDDIPTIVALKSEK